MENPEVLTGDMLAGDVLTADVLSGDAFQRDTDLEDFLEGAQVHGRDVDALAR